MAISRSCASSVILLTNSRVYTYLGDECTDDDDDDDNNNEDDEDDEMDLQSLIGGDDGIDTDDNDDTAFAASKEIRVDSSSINVNLNHSKISR